VFSAGEGAVKFYRGHVTNDPNAKMFGTLDIAIVGAAIINPWVGLAFGIGVFGAECASE
jgi:hypothetical protein